MPEGGAVLLTRGVLPGAGAVQAGGVRRLGQGGAGQRPRRLCSRHHADAGRGPEPAGACAYSAGSRP